MAWARASALSWSVPESRSSTRSPRSRSSISARLRWWASSTVRMVVAYSRAKSSSGPAWWSGSSRRRTPSRSPYACALLDRRPNTNAAVFELHRARQVVTPVTRCTGTPEGAYEALEKYGRDLVVDARTGKLDPVIGRDTEIRRVVQILSRKSKNNPVLILAHIPRVSNSPKMNGGAACYSTRGQTVIATP